MTEAKFVKAGDQELADFASNYARNQQAAHNEQRGMQMQYRYTPDKMQTTIKMTADEQTPFKSAASGFLVGGKDSFSNLG